MECVCWQAARAKGPLGWRAFGRERGVGEKIWGC